MQSATCGRVTGFRGTGAGTASTILWPLWSHTKLRQIALDFLPHRQFARRSENG
jgi:hypothetical protein